MSKGHYIHGRWDQGNGEGFTSTDPATGERIWEGPAARGEEIDRAVLAAHDAFAAWSGLSLADRIAFLHRFGERVRQHKPGFSEWISREIGKPRWEADAEVDAVAGKVDQSIGAYSERRKSVRSEAAEVTSVTRYKPHGVVAVFGPFNFPAHLPNGHIVPALLAGNTVVLKPSEAAPRVAEFMVDLWSETGLPPGVLNLVQGGRETGKALASHPAIDGVFFTGSFAAGSAINQMLAAEPGKIVALEMGGNSPLVVHRVADLTAAAYMIIQSAYATAGQRCTCARRLIVPDGPQAEPLLDRLVAMTQTIRVGRYTDEPQPFSGPVISDTAAAKVLAAQDELRRRGGRIRVELKSVGPRAAMLSPGLIDTTDVPDRGDTEVFGPLLQIIRVGGFDDAVREANHTRYGLAAGLLSDDRTLWETFFRRIRAGVVNWNRPTTGAGGGLPFGGIGRSGNHRPSGYFAADYCSYPVASMESNSLSLPGTLTPGIDI
jgi:succinylglutamic semialdehyde dehydrogenase